MPLKNPHMKTLQKRAEPSQTGAISQPRGETSNLLKYMHILLIRLSATICADFSGILLDYVCPPAAH